MMNNKIGILWDMDGVLVDTIQYHFSAWREVLEEKGVSISLEEYKKTFGINNKHFIQLTLGENTDQKIINEMSTQKEIKYREYLKNKIILFEGVKEILEKFKSAGFIQSITTSAPQDNINAIMQATRIKPYFKIIYSCNNKASKQNPDAYLATSKLANLKNNWCVVIEDSILGIEGAHRAGMKCIGVATTHAKENLKKADLIINSIEELSPDLIMNLLN